MANKNGFTLIEVLIVVFIIGLLASVVLVGLGGFRSRGRDARRIADLRNIQHALELYYQANNEYPKVADFGDLKEALLNGAPAGSPANDLGVNEVPADPLGGNYVYQYGADAAGQKYILGARLEDKTNQALKNDFDGTAGPDTFDVECGDPSGDEYYCIKP